MADTLGNIILTAGVWTDLYSESGIALGTQIIVQNIGVCDVFLTSALDQPTDEDARQISERGVFLINDAGDSGAWALCSSSGAGLNVSVA